MGTERKVSHEQKFRGQQHLNKRQKKSSSKINCSGKIMDIREAAGRFGIMKAKGVSRR